MTRDPREGEAMRGLRELPVEQREVVVLKIWHGLTFASIAGMMSISPNTVAGRYRYGLQKLRRSLNKWSEDEWGRDRESDTILGTASRVEQA